METSEKKLAMVVVMVVMMTMTMTTLMTLTMMMKGVKVVFLGGVLSFKRFENLNHANLLFFIFAMASWVINLV